jgi:hypothetical protein
VKAALVSLILGAVISAFAADPPVIPVVPDTFLKTDIEAWQRVLAKPVKAEFQMMLLQDALHFLFRDSNANVIMAPASDAPVQEVMITCNIPEVPLRTALYIISKESGAIVTWDMEGGGPRAIKILFK